MTIKVLGYAAKSAQVPLAPLEFTRRDPRPDDVVMDVLYCGVCHSDLHQARNDWGFSSYPLVPGHEVVGRDTAVGKSVTKFKVGDFAGIGCMVDSCRTCDCCKSGLEQYCSSWATFTYNSPDKHHGGHTFGGYSSGIVVDEAFTLRVPQGMDLAAHAFAQGGVDHAVAGQRQLAAEGLGHHRGLAVHAVIALHVRAGARQAGFDQFTDGFGVQRAFLIKYPAILPAGAPSACPSRTP